MGKNTTLTLQPVLSVFTPAVQSHTKPRTLGSGWCTPLSLDDINGERRRLETFIAEEEARGTQQGLRPVPNPYLDPPPPAAAAAAAGPPAAQNTNKKVKVKDEEPEFKVAPKVAPAAKKSAKKK